AIAVSPPCRETACKWTRACPAAYCIALRAAACVAAAVARTTAGSWPRPARGLFVQRFRGLRAARRSCHIRPGAPQSRRRSVDPVRPGRLYSAGSPLLVPLADRDADDAGGQIHALDPARSGGAAHPLFRRARARGKTLAVEAACRGGGGGRRVLATGGAGGA